MRVTKVQATVYVAAGKRHFRKDACYKTLARRYIRSLCECYRGDRDSPGESCWYHERTDVGEYHNLKLATAWLITIFKQAEQEGWDDATLLAKWNETLEKILVPAETKAELKEIAF